MPISLLPDAAPPHDLDAERGLLGALLLQPERLADPACAVAADDFHAETHRDAFATLTALHAAGTPIDAVTFADAHARRGGRADAESVRLAIDLMTATPHAAHAPHYAGIVRALAARRRFAERAFAAGRAAYDADAGPDALRERLAAAADALAASPPARPTLAVRRLAAVTPRPVAWLWPGRIPLGKLTLVAGDPGLGKSFLTVDLAARVSVGRPWPDAGWNPAADGNPDAGNAAGPGSVVMFSAEDDPEDTIRPRLDAAGGDPARVLAVDGVHAAARRGSRPRSFCLETDLPALDDLLGELAAGPAPPRLVTIDPISSYGDGRTDTHKNADVRALLAPLGDLAARRGVAVVAVTHLNKAGGGKAVYRATGSLAYVAAARAGWLVVKDADDPARRLFVPVKNNLAPDQGGLAYRIENPDGRGPHRLGGRLAWEPDPVDLHGDDALAAEGGDRGGRGDGRDEAEDFLRAALADGPAAARDVTAAARAEGIGEKALKTARTRLCDTRREGFGPGGGYNWRLKPTVAGRHPDAHRDHGDHAGPSRGRSGMVLHGAAGRSGPAFDPAADPFAGR